MRRVVPGRAPRRGRRGGADVRARGEGAEGGADVRARGEGADGGADVVAEPKSFEHVFPAHRMRVAIPGEPDGDEDEGRGEDARSRAGRSTRWLASNPYTVPTERDLVCESKWRPVYRFVARRRA